jgi:retron-type reverse transcriptase
MADLNKSQLYREVAQMSDEVLLVRMRQQGFWGNDQPLSQDPPPEAAERTAVLKEIADLRRTASAVKNPEKALAKERKRRWDESKKRRAENKKKREIERQQRCDAYAAHKAVHVVHVGAGVSAGLQGTAADTEALARRNLPVINNGNHLASLMGITLPALRWLTYHRRSATVVHYRRFAIAKKTGGVRHISAPKAALAAAQRWVFDNLLARLGVEAQAHGFVRGRSIVSNAAPHAGRAAVINLDLKEFFPSITFRRVKGLFEGFGYGEHVATLLALLCTEPPRVPAEVDGKVYHVALGDRVLPQGACTSPALTNALCWRLDRRLAALAAKHGFAYTRYADDLTFSGNKPAAVGRLLRSVRSILEAEGYREHPTKTRVMRRSRRQEVTGVTVNARPTVSRQAVRELRAILHNAARHGLESQNREQRPNFPAYLKGRVEFVCMVDPQRGVKLRTAMARILAGPGRADQGH